MSSKNKGQGNNRRHQHHPNSAKTDHHSDSPEGQNTAEAKPANQGGHNKPDPPKQTPQKGCMRFNNLTPIDKFTFVIATFTALLFFATAFNIFAFIQSERSLLGLTKISIKGDEFKTGVPLIILMNVKNSGKSTAFADAESTVILLTAKPLPDKPAYQATVVQRAGQYLEGENYPTFTIGTRDNGDPMILTGEEISRLDQGKLHLFVYGFITSHDRVWPLSSTVRYCFSWDFWRPESTIMGRWGGCGKEAYE